MFLNKAHKSEKLWAFGCRFPTKSVDFETLVRIPEQEMHQFQKTSDLNIVGCRASWKVCVHCGSSKRSIKLLRIRFGSSVQMT